ncbi:MAG: LAGLIDADG family homing endonuclease, partial [Nitrospirota bacterium]
MVVFAKSGAGKSVDKSTKFIVRRNGVVEIKEIGAFIDHLMDSLPTTKIEEEIEGVVNPGIEVMTFDKDLKAAWSPVTIAARKDFNKRRKLYKITTKSGREITVTADHNLVTLRNGKMRVMRSEAVKIGERLPLSHAMPEPEKASQPAYLIPDQLVKNWPNKLPKRINVTSKFTYLLGLITSEGHITSKVLEIYNAEKSIQDSITSTCEEIGFSYHLLRLSKSNRRIKGIRISPNHIAKLVVAIGTAGLAGDKRIPSIVFSLDNEKAAAYLRGYFDGDGCVEQHEVSACTKSKDLMSDLAYLLLRFGIIARMSKKFKRATNAKNHKGDIYWELKISGKDHIQKFAQSIGFSHPEKIQRLQKLVLKLKMSKGNTNVDTIPGLQSVFRHIYNSIYPTSEIKAPQIIIDIKNGIYSPSREQLLRAVSLCENRLNQLRSIAPYIKILRELPPVSRLISLGSKNKLFNHILWENLGDSWRNIKRCLHPPLVKNALFVYQTVSGKMLTAPLLSSTLYSAFKEQGVSLRKHNSSLWNAVVLEKSKNTQYDTFFKAAKYISQKYRSTQLKIRHAQEKLDQLKLLAKSDL